jgi:hypothetical protein
MNRPNWTGAGGLLDCPACGLPAEIVDRFIIDGSPYPVEHVKIKCLAGHWFTPPVSDRDMIDQRDRREPSFERRPRTPLGLRRLLELTKNAARRVRDQADKEERARLVARLAALDGAGREPSFGVMARQAPRDR